MGEDIINLTVNGKNFQGRNIRGKRGQTVLEVLKDNGIHVPTLCYHPRMPPYGGCRLCIVEIENMRGLPPSCTTPATDGMVVNTHSPKVVGVRKTVLELLLAYGDHNCLLCEQTGSCELQNLVYEHGIDHVRIKSEFVPKIKDDSHPMIVRDHNKCVLCGRCVRACLQVQVNGAIDIAARGSDSYITTFNNTSLAESSCVSCGQCVQACPVGALTEKKSRFKGRAWEMKKVRTTCPYCGVGCQMWLHVKGGRIVKVTGVEEGAPNHGRLCVKGRFGYDFIYSEDRLKTPLIKSNDGFREASWDEALDLVASRLKKIIAKHGPDSVAGVSSARSINEDSYQMQKLFRTAIGTNNIDNCARVCHAPTVAGLAKSFGSGAMTNSFDDFANAKMILAIGTNATEAHPVAGTYLKNAVAKGAELIVVDPRRIELADHAVLHAQIKVGSDIAFLNGVMNVLINENLHDKQYVASYTDGFESLKAKVMEYPPEKAAGICGVSAEMIRDVARRLASVKPALLVYTLGITEHTCGMNNVLSCANLQMLLGNVGFACGGVNPIRGQNNVQGACDMGALPNLFPGYQRVDDPKAQEKFKAAWNVASLPDRPGIMLPQMLDGLADGKIKAFYIFGENLANSEPDIKHVEHCLSSAEFLICQDNFPNETTRFADVILPAAAWSENDGTFASSERRISRVRTASEAPGISRPNWWIFKEIARRMGQDWKSESGQELWDDEISVLSPPFAGIKYSRIEGDGLQWPVPTETHPGTPVMHKDGKFTGGRGQFVAVDWTPPKEVPDAEYPFTFCTGRRLYHYHTRTQTGRCQGLNELLGEETADISRLDAAELGIEDGEYIRVRSRRGEVKVKARVTDRMQKGNVWMAFHFREACANWLTNPVFDPVTQTAEYKACAVKVEKIV
ncbi:formate dehydrogenase subunit alpha [Syntrophobacter fumaroxidans]|uniref:Formate dehydrogenase, alpha subunit n=1 Tax=Syntrophobacter fumaroxidans (strain DSM 10017 / MPOB) TaxID=335543 RepID=A0LP28_SYNFM|nr:formate dehydrogenase subunit alpha [Syntrophobacter fumaroxidans]ABK19180.1 formate dehydrogenase, alpha subunit [Syntrophobacter fumaroxidans MPOB]